MSKVAAIFPGQGAQLVGMGRDVADRYAVAADTFAEADAVVGFPLSQLCFEGPADRLSATDIQQPAIFVASVAIWRAALEAGVLRRESVVATGGLSLGEYTALHLAGAVAFGDALRLVRRRGELMQQAAEARAGGMVSLIGADEEKALALCERVATYGTVRPANFNCPGQIVLSGDKPACEAAAQQADQVGCRAVILPVAGAFHSDHMQPAADGLAPVLAATAFTTPAIPVVSNVDAEYHDDPASIRRRLAEQVTHPVRWQACVERLIADGCSEFYEIGPNRHLTGMLRKIDRRMKATNLGTAADLSPAG